jgi:predicted DNA-binding WGR domain protein
MNAFNDPNYKFKPIYITADDVNRSVEFLKRSVSAHVIKNRKMTNVQVTFRILGGRSKTFNLDTTNELFHLNKGDTAEITHRQENWGGSYEVLERIENTSGIIVYNLLLTSLELRHTHEDHNKRWLVSTKDGGKTVQFSWGKIGGALQSKEKVFPSYHAAAVFIHEKIEEKLRKGYNQK